MSPAFHVKEDQAENISGFPKLPFSLFFFLYSPTIWVDEVTVLLHLKQGLREACNADQLVVPPRMPNSGATSACGSRKQPHLLQAHQAQSHQALECFHF